MEQSDSWKNPFVYAVKHKNPDVRMNSRSGGFFTALSDFVLNQGGVVYGCVLTDEFEAVHVRADNSEMRDSMRGSKYVQSRMNDVFFNIKRDLQDSRRWVLFTGTPCQVSGLKGFLDDDYDRLILADIVCHGVPSPEIWRQYLAWQEIQNGKCSAVDFRNKKDFGWADHVETLRFGDKTVNSKVFTSIFYGHWALRPCCYQCPFRSLHRVGDVSMADYWEIDRAYPGFNDNKGVSLVFVNNDKGATIFDAIKSDFEWKQTKLEDSVRPSMVHPFPVPKDRNSFWKDFLGGSFKKVAWKYTGDGLMPRISRKISKWNNTIKKTAHTHTLNESTKYVHDVNDSACGTQGVVEAEPIVGERKELPELYSDKRDCCGCTACYAACPSGAVFMQPDEEGFLYPAVDVEKCTRCYQCLAVCAFKRQLSSDRDVNKETFSA